MYQMSCHQPIHIPCISSTFPQTCPPVASTPLATSSSIVAHDLSLYRSSLPLSLFPLCPALRNASTPLPFPSCVHPHPQPVTTPQHMHCSANTWVSFTPEGLAHESERRLVISKGKREDLYQSREEVFQPGLGESGKDHIAVEYKFSGSVLCWLFLVMICWPGMSMINIFQHCGGAYHVAEQEQNNYVNCGFRDLETLDVGDIVLFWSIAAVTGPRGR